MQHKMLAQGTDSKPNFYSDSVASAKEMRTSQGNRNVGAMATTRPRNAVCAPIAIELAADLVTENVQLPCNNEPQR